MTETELIVQWRASAEWEIEHGSPEFGKGRDQCADELETLLAERLPPQDAQMNMPIAPEFLTLTCDGCGRKFAVMKPTPPPQEEQLTADEYALLASILTDHAADASESEDVDRNAEAPLLHALALKLGRLVPVGYLPKPLGSPTP